MQGGSAKCFWKAASIQATYREINPYSAGSDFRDVTIWRLYKRQILTSKIDSRAVRVKIFIKMTQK